MRTYEDLIGGETAFNQGTSFYVKKYAYDYELGRGELLQTYIIPDTQTDLMFKLVDTQLRYDKSCEYEITLNTAVMGTATKIKHLYIADNPGFPSHDHQANPKIPRWHLRGYKVEYLMGRSWLLARSAPLSSCRLVAREAQGCQLYKDA